MKIYTNQTLNNLRVTRKIDGVKLIVDDNIYTSRAGKQLHNLPLGLPNGTYEVFIGDWGKSVSAVRTHNGAQIDINTIYQLTPRIDNRLDLGYYVSLDKKELSRLFLDALRDGYEGLVLHFDNGVQLKLKPKDTYDIKVIGLKEGTGRNEGKLGAFITEKGNVGSGLTDIQRINYFKEALIGSIIEVDAMKLTNLGKFRHPRFIRLREDKNN